MSSPRWGEAFWTVAMCASSRARYSNTAGATVVTSASFSAMRVHLQDGHGGARLQGVALATHVGLPLAVDAQHRGTRQQRRRPAHTS